MADKPEQCGSKGGSNGGLPVSGAKKSASEENKRTPTYTGEVKNGQFHGHGIVTSGDGFRYEGMWKEGKRHGWGKAETDAQKYEGEWVGDTMHGHGTIVWQSSAMYVGDFKNGLRDGVGSFKGLAPEQPGKERFMHVGKFERDAKSGEGQDRYATGARYFGEFQNDQRHGRGTMTSKCGRVTYEGMWENGCTVGYGTYMFYFKGGGMDTMTGNWVKEADMFSGRPMVSVEGRATYVFANGDTFQGDCQKGVPNGHGVLFLGGKVVYRATWQDGKSGMYDIIKNTDKSSSLYGSLKLNCSQPQTAQEGQTKGVAVKISEAGSRPERYCPYPLGCKAQERNFREHDQC